MNNILVQQVVGLIVRHTITAIGVSQLFDKATTDQVVGAVCVLIGIAWSIYQKVKTGRKHEISNSSS